MNVEAAQAIAVLMLLLRQGVRVSMADTFNQVVFRFRIRYRL